MTPSNDLIHLPVFVYGTLQRGEERSGRWPCSPLRVEWSTIRGRVLDLGPYPGLVEGDDVVLGELWHLRAEDITETLRVLDEIECYGNDEVDLYVRRVVVCVSLSGESHQAYTYFLAELPPGGNSPPVVPADERGYCHWRRHGPGLPS